MGCMNNGIMNQRCKTIISISILFNDIVGPSIYISYNFQKTLQQHNSFGNNMTKVQPFDAILHQQTTTIATDDATTTTTSSSSQVDQVSFIRSIKFTLILMISILLVLSVIVLSAIWLGKSSTSLSKR